MKNASLISCLYFLCSVLNAQNSSFTPASSRVVNPCNLNANFTYSTNPTGQVNFNSNSSGTVVGTTYVWNFGNATTGSGNQTSHNYSASGSYVVLLTANNNSTPTCISTFSQLINITIAPTVTTSVETSLCDDEAQDSYLASGTPHLNFGNHTSLGGNTWTCNGTLCLSRALFKFNLSSIPTNATITNATLKLFANLGWSNSPTTGPSNDAHLYRITSPWVENTVTWNSQPSTTQVNKVYVPASSGTAQNYVLNVTNLVQDMISSSNFGFMLKMDDEINFYKSLMFASSDNPTSGVCPVLNIEYSTSTITGIGERTKGSMSFDIYPNPFSSEINLETNLIDATAVIYDVFGKVIKSESVSGLSRIATEDMTSGIYFLSVYTTDKQLVGTRKIVK